METHRTEKGIEELTAEELKNLAKALAAVQRNRLVAYTPYPKQEKFHNLSATKRERMLLAANQVGKTWSAGFEVAMHVTGRYPDWWKGHRFEGATKWWFASTSGETTRDNPQRVLFGEIGRWGTGAIPKIDLVETKRSHAVPDAIEIAQVKHQSGGVSMLQSKSYDQQRKGWFGETLHGIWFDEEPPSDIYTEGLTRTSAFKGMALLTLTPMLGMTDIVHLFYPQPNTPERALVQMDITDAEHFSADEREKIIRKYPKYEREARAHGIPMLGTGRVFPVSESDISVPAFEIPKHWPQVAGLDFGYDHPTAAARLAWDQANDIVYLTGAYRVAEATIAVHVSALRKWGAWLPFAWPQDGYQHESGSGLTVANLYRKEGVRLLPEHAAKEYGKKHLDVVTAEMLDRMTTGRWKVFDHLHGWFEEFRIYHKEFNKTTGKVTIVKIRDDLISASRTAMMALRYARPAERVLSNFPATVGMDYDPFSAGQGGSLRIDRGFQRTN